MDLDYLLNSLAAFYLVKYSMVKKMIEIVFMDSKTITTPGYSESSPSSGMVWRVKVMVEITFTPKARNPMICARKKHMRKCSIEIHALKISWILNEIIDKKCQSVMNKCIMIYQVELLHKKAVHQTLFGIKFS